MPTLLLVLFSALLGALLTAGTITVLRDKLTPWRVLETVLWLIILCVVCFGRHFL